MISTRQFGCFFVIVMSFASLLQADKVPSTDEIEDYNDPVLREVFASSQKQRPNVELRPHESQSGYAPTVPTRVPSPYSAGYSATQRPVPSYGSVPQPAGYRPTYSNPSQAPLSSGYNSPASDLGSLAAQGAQTFVQGAQQVGRVFGIDSSSYGGSNYEFPLNGGFFGK